MGSRALAPITLLKQGRIDEARLLAVSSLPERSKALPDWLLNAPIDPWSDQELRRHELGFQVLPTDHSDPSNVSKAQE
jgi:hypothetical protein